MRRLPKTVLIAVAVIFSFGIATVGMGAGRSSFTTEAASAVKINISEDQAVRTALEAYEGSELISVKLYETAYTVRIITPEGKRYIKIGALSGRILEDYPINAQGKIDRTGTSGWIAN
jgi:hypothetical protein